MSGQDEGLVQYACAALSWAESKGTLAHDLYKRGVVEFGSFTLSNPKISPSPIYFNLRTPNHPTNPGKLTPYDVERIAAELFGAVQASGITCNVVAGIPHAGEPFAHTFLGLASGVYLATFEKTEQGRICCYNLSDEARRSKKFIEKTPQVLLVDDVLSSGDSALEAWDAIGDKLYGGCMMRQFAVFIDREQGGRERLEEQGCKIVSVFKISELLNFYVLTGGVTKKKRQEVMRYIERSRKIIAAS